MIPPAQADRHHLVPKSRGGRQTAFLHRVCHREVHALFTESELARQYTTGEALLQHPERQAFVAWAKTKPEDFFVRTHESTRIHEPRGEPLALNRCDGPVHLTQAA
ncbi:MAG: HNH endonuclease [Burkholderiaceae bacterium]|nr:HNH endonuclease [Burkholderiaceae bacterium]